MATHHDLDSKHQMNIVEDGDDQSRAGMLADTDAEEDSSRAQRPRQSDTSLHSHTLQATTNNFVDETQQPGRGESPRVQYEEPEWQQQEQKNELLRFLENQNAETLKAIQHENSTFIQQYSNKLVSNESRDTSFFSADHNNQIQN